MSRINNRFSVGVHMMTALGDHHGEPVTSSDLTASVRAHEGRAVRDGLKQVAHRPFRVVPYFDPGPWGGHWMEEVCGLPKGIPNYAWCFDCVPEVNSLLLDFGGTRVEIPAMNVTLLYPRELLGDEVFSRFGAEFPIRFDFLDTMGGGNLSRAGASENAIHP